MDAPDTVVLDLDGTLVDSLPVHVLAWQAAFAEIDVAVPSHRVQRVIGMGGDRLVAAVAGQQVEDEHGDRLRDRHPAHLDRLFDEIRPAEGAVELLHELKDQGYASVLASSSDRGLTERLLGLLDGAADLLDQTVTGSDADRTKPSGQLIEVALDAVDARRAVVVGDAVWDVKAAQGAGVPCIGLLTGGISSAELEGAGAVAVFDSALELAREVRRTGLVPQDR